MNEWEPWRQDDNGARFRIRGYADRVGAIAGRLVIESGLPHKQMYWVAGPPVPTCPTPADAADLIEALSADPEPSAAAFLAAFQRVGESSRDDSWLEPDTIATVFRAAWDTAEPAAGERESGADAGSGHADHPVSAPGRARDHLTRAAVTLRIRDPRAVMRRQDLLDLVTHAPR
ncbi:hypothetical protein [Embleya hyalina]|uniref:Uncharacterized protein n=1 Tax=Embleya hyalina TaxID=516124 RepID=A0A401YZI4_9ACTN|nr:hypothetical protein [Embleya hyalina]GCE00050.1 hypothetical protein EHYA_07774 [Embleya hyalina]